jgi:hypothetical protein
LIHTFDILAILIKSGIRFAPIIYSMHKASINKVITTLLKHNHDNHSHKPLNQP